jgi:hypothetical protein
MFRFLVGLHVQIFFGIRLFSITYCLFDDALSKPHYRLHEWIMNWRGYGRRSSWDNLRHHPGIHLVGLRATTNRGLQGKLHLLLAGWIFHLIFNPEDGIGTFLRNICKRLQYYTASHLWWLSQLRFEQDTTRTRALLWAKTYISVRPRSSQTAGIFVRALFHTLPAETFSSPATS